MGTFFDFDFLATFNFAWLSSLLIFWAVIVLGAYNHHPDRTHYLYLGSAMVLGSIVFVVSVFFSGAFAIEVRRELVQGIARVILSLSLSCATVGTILWARERKRNR